MSDLETRVAVLETKVTDISEKVSNHEQKTERIFERISETLDDIRDEIKNFTVKDVITKAEIDKINLKAGAIWQTLCYISVTITTILTLIYHAYDVFVK